MSRMLEGKNIIVTGANRGIGKAITSECLNNHANVWACMRSVTEDTQRWMERLQEKSGCKISPVILDFEDDSSIKEACSAILDEKRSIDGIVNNAGISGSTGLFSMTEMETIKKTFQINFFGPMLFTQRFLKRVIRQKKCSIVNITSIASLDGEPGQFDYVSSKAAINGATRKLSSELGQFGIRVNAVAPGTTDTDMIKEMSEELLRKTMERTSLNRLGRPEEVGRLVAFLLSEQSDFITGQIIRIDGGGI